MPSASASQLPRAVVTGIGLVTPLGRVVADFYRQLCAPCSGLTRPPEGHAAAGLVDAVGLVPDIDPGTVVKRTDAAVADRFSILAVAAADDAIADSGLKIGQDVDSLRVAVVMSTGAGGMLTFERQALAMQLRGAPGVSPYLYAGFLPNMAAARIAIKHGIHGYSSAISTACAASAHAIADAFRLITAGDADVVVCGGTEASLGRTGIAGFRNARALASGWSDPAQASRPFDKDRNGFVIGEGGGALVIERADLADARGAAGYADLTGWGASTDAYHLITPNPDGSRLADCMRIALGSAGLSPRDVGYVNAHGTGTRIGDVAEAQALRLVFGDDQPPVSSTKGVTGHLLGGAGVVEAAACALALTQGVLPPTHNLDNPDPRCDLNHIRGGGRGELVDVVVSNSSAFGGHNVSLVFQRASTRLRRSDPMELADTMR
jgi:3-oxoacyl-[acyl-carrier-protein] synthase II